MPHDVEVFGNQFPAYRDDPVAQTRRAVAAPLTDLNHAQRYVSFCGEMVYGEVPSFAEAFATVAALADRLRARQSSL